jgi:electron transfer flavoprotein alpha subunit
MGTPPNVLAVTEQRGGTLRKVSREVVTVARRIADALGGGGGSVDALVIGPAGVDCAALAAAGADRVLAAEDAAFASYAPDGYAATVAAQAQAGGYAAIVMAASAAGRDLAPRVAVRLDVPLVADVTQLTVEGGKVVATRPVYAGKALQTVTIDATPVLVSIRPNTFTPVETARAGTASRVEAAAAAARVTVRETKQAAQGALDVAEAPIVVSGGRGLKGPEHFGILEDLASAFGNAAVGASRAVVDAGWRPHGEQVGQTGKTVSPSLYIAVGISGAIQHLAGMRTAKVIVAINRDKDAPIFKCADYGIVGDLFEIVPKLAEEIRKVRSH